MEFVRPTETNPQEINDAAQAKDDYEDLRDVGNGNTSIGDNNTFDDLFVASSDLSSEGARKKR